MLVIKYWGKSRELCARAIELDRRRSRELNDSRSISINMDSIQQLATRLRVVRILL